MIIKTFVSTAILAGLAIAVAVPADAATRKQGASKKTSTTIYYRQSDPSYYAAPRRQNRRLIVQPRSYLSAGTQTKQDEERYMTYAFPLNSSFDYNYRNSAQGSFLRMPLPDPWSIPGWPKY